MPVLEQSFDLNSFAYMSSSGAVFNNLVGVGVEVVLLLVGAVGAADGVVLAGVHVWFEVGRDVVGLLPVELVGAVGVVAFREDEG